MHQAIEKKFPKHTCQHCGSDRKLVETIIDDEFYWSEKEKRYEPNKFMDEFEHTGNVVTIRFFRIPRTLSKPQTE